METMTEDAFDKLNGQSERIKKEINEWAISKNYPFIVYGRGFSNLAYSFMNDVGSEMKTHRDFWYNADNDKTHIYALEIATRGFYPVVRGQMALSLPMTDEDITSYIEITKDIVAEILE